MPRWPASPRSTPPSARRRRDDRARHDHAAATPSSATSPRLLAAPRSGTAPTRRARRCRSRPPPRHGAARPPARMVAIVAQAEVGQAEQPPGSNDSPRIAQYRAATAGGGVGPWCAYFVSWAAREAGVPLGDHGQGFGRVDACTPGRSAPAAPSRPAPARPPQPGDLIVWDEHIGIVESVLPDGTHPDHRGQLLRPRLPARPRRRGGAIGYVRLSQ